MKTPLSFAAGAALLSLVAGWMLWHPKKSAQGHGAAHASAAPSRAEQPKTSSSALIAKMLNGEFPKLSPAELAAFVEKRNHSVDSLLAAWRLGEGEGSKAWLEEAASLHPDDPRVALAEVMSKDNAPTERKEWIARLQENAPDNALGWCYAALDAFKEGRRDDAQEAIAEATLRPALDAYAKDSMREFTEAFRNAGYEGPDAEFLGRASVPIPQAAVVMNLLKEQMAAADDDAGSLADLLPLAGLVRGQDANEPLISQLVGVAVEKKVLSGMDALDLVPGSDVPVAERLAELDAERLQVKDTVQSALPLLPTLTRSEFKQYLRRTDVEGELKAMQWVLNQKRTR